MLTKFVILNPPTTPNAPTDPSLIEMLRKLFYEAPTKSQTMQDIEKKMFDLQDKLSPDWSNSVSNKITESLSNKMDDMIGQSTDKIVMWYQNKLDELLHWLKFESLDIIQIGFVCYLVYLCFRMIFKSDDNEKNFSNMYLSIMSYTIVRLFWKITFAV